MAFDMKDLNRCVVAITAVNLDTNVYAGFNRQVGQIAIHANMQPGGHVSIPCVGEQWMVEKISGAWFLHTKTDWADERTTAIPREEGLDVLGTMNGPTHITGTSVNLPEEVTLGGHRVRLNPTTGVMETYNGTTWVPVVPAPAPYVPPPAETRDVPAIFYHTALSVSPTGTYVTLPFAFYDGNTAYTANGSGIIVLPYTGWYAASVFVRANNWSGASPAFDSTTGGFVNVDMERQDSGGANPLKLTGVLDPKVGAFVPGYSLNTEGFQGTAGQLVRIKVAQGATNNATLNFTTGSACRLVIRWMRGL